MLHLTDLDELTRNIRSSYVREYVTESLAAYQAGAYRAAVSTLWVAVCIDIIEKIRELAVDGDTSAKAIEAKLNAIKPMDFSSMLDFENNLIDIASGDLEFVSKLDAIHLERLKQDRNISVHPTFQQDGQHIKVTSETARNHFVNACNILFLHPPTKGKVFLDLIFERISEQSFPDDEEKAYISLSSGNSLGRAKDSVKKNLVIILLKRLFADSEKMDLPHVERIMAAIKAIKRMAPEIYKNAMKDYFCKLLANTDEFQFKRVFHFINSDPSSWSLLDEPAKIRMLNVIRVSHAEEIVMYRLCAVATAVDSISKPLKDRILQLESSDQAMIASTTPSKISKDIAIKLFTSSGSFSAAQDRGAKLLLPHSQFFAAGDIKTILDSSLANKGLAKINQILNASGIDLIFAELFSKTKMSIQANDIWLEFWKQIEGKYELKMLGSALANSGVITPPYNKDDVEEIPF